MNVINRTQSRVSELPEIGLTFFSSGIYLAVIILLIRDYAAVEWSIYLYSFGNISSIDFLILIISLIICAIAVPKNIDSPSSMILVVTYLIIVLPAAACLTAMDYGASDGRYYILIMISLGFFLASIICNDRRGNIQSISEYREPSNLLGPILTILGVLLMIYLFIRFRSIMSFASLDTLYEQRARGAAGNLLDGYAQTYSQYVISTGLLALGMYRRNILYIMVGLAGSIMNYTITAEKAGLVYPFAIICLFMAVKMKRRLFVTTSMIAIILSFVLFFSIYTRAFLSTSEFICWYIGTRTILTPGAFVVHYADFFAERGYTFFSHIRGFNLFVPAPAQFANDPRWPALGVILGEDFIGLPRLNANASYVASDGIAGMGEIGIVVAFVTLAAFGTLLNRLGRGINPALLLPLLLPIALTLTNGSLFTVFLSMGGLFWTLALSFGFTKSKEPKKLERII